MTVIVKYLNKLNRFNSLLQDFQISTYDIFWYYSLVSVLNPYYCLLRSTQTGRHLATRPEFNSQKLVKPNTKILHDMQTN